MRTCSRNSLTLMLRYDHFLVVWTRGNNCKIYFQIQTISKQTNLPHSYKNRQQHSSLNFYNAKTKNVLGKSIKMLPSPIHLYCAGEFAEGSD